MLPTDPIGAGVEAGDAAVVVGDLSGCRRPLRLSIVEAGDAAVVVGDGAVGLCGVLAAQRLGAERVVAMATTRTASTSPVSSERPT